jgi:hypothetical protein
MLKYCFLALRFAVMLMFIPCELSSSTYSNVLPFMNVYSYYYYRELAEIFSFFSSDTLIDCSESLKITIVSCMKWLQLGRI